MYPVCGVCFRLATRALVSFNTDVGVRSGSLWVGWGSVRALCRPTRLPTIGLALRTASCSNRNGNIAASDHMSIQVCKVDCTTQLFISINTRRIHNVKYNNTIHWQSSKSVVPKRCCLVFALDLLFAAAWKVVGTCYPRLGTSALHHISIGKEVVWSECFAVNCSHLNNMNVKCDHNVASPVQTFMYRYFYYS